MQKCARSAGMHHETRAIFGTEVAQGCAACAAPSPLMTRNVCADTRACFPQILRRTRTRRAQKQMQNCARSAGKRANPAKKIARGCAACVASSLPMTHNVCAETRACFLRSLRRTRANLARNSTDRSVCLRFSGGVYRAETLITQGRIR